MGFPENMILLSGVGQVMMVGVRISVVKSLKKKKNNSEPEGIKAASELTSLRAK